MKAPLDVPPTEVLANERTYLAYVRTAIALIAFGFVIARFGLFEREIAVVAHITLPHAGAVSSIFGPLMSIAGVIVALFGAYRYAVADRGLREGKTLALRPFVAYIAAIAVAAVGVIVAFIIAPPR
ncbi:MAG TPA: DUF202 domain-containing protein [Candidatus Acidoferrales bacterium]|nr:DUF202 domain-containing protein [Candidatus Acidoferrales bacterium]